MITKQFIHKLNEAIPKDRLDLVYEFFIIFSRFECALKAAEFINISTKGRISANWNTFAKDIKDSFNENEGDTPGLKSAVDYLIDNPPKIQVIRQNNIDWDKRDNTSEPLIYKLSQSIRDIRNNLFHGGKFQDNYHEEISRNYELLNSSIIILNEWLKLNESVKSFFLSPIN